MVHGYRHRDLQQPTRCTEACFTVFESFNHQVTNGLSHIDEDQMSGYSHHECLWSIFGYAVWAMDRVITIFYETCNQHKRPFASYNFLISFIQDNSQTLRLVYVRLYEVFWQLSFVTMSFNILHLLPNHSAYHSYFCSSSNEMATFHSLRSQRKLCNGIHCFMGTNWLIPV